MDEIDDKKITSAELASFEYDQIAEKYQEATRRPSRKYILEPSLIQNLGDLHGKRVLDLACGEGYSSRLCSSLGSEDVVGVDISKKEIEMAKQIGNPDGLGKIEYFVGDAAGEMGDLGSFDMVAAVMLLHYCSSEEMIRKILQNIKSRLTQDGQFVVSMPNPDIMQDYEGYGVKLKGNAEEGSQVDVTLSNFDTGEELCSFTNYFWSKETYTRLFREEGFDPEWHDAIVAPEAIEKYGPDFWKKFYEKPVYEIIKAKLS